jgi:hypothetical protein
MLDRDVVVGDKLRSTVNSYGLWNVVAVNGGYVEVENGENRYTYTQGELKDFMVFAE